VETTTTPNLIGSPTAEWQRHAATCALEGTPIPLEVFLASHGETTPPPPPPPRTGRAPLIATATPSNEARMYRSREFLAIEEGVASFIERFQGTHRPDLQGRAVKEVVSVLEAEVKGYIAAAYGSDLGGTNHKGVDIPEWNVDIKTITSGQSRLRYGCGCERALGTAEHALVLPYSLDGTLLTLENADFVPAWRTADIVASAEAETVRRLVHAGEISVTDALAALLEAGHIAEPCLHITRALAGEHPINTGSVTLSRVEPVWQTRYNHVSGVTPAGSRVRRVGSPDSEKVSKLVSLRLKNRAGQLDTNTACSVGAATVCLALAPLGPVAAGAAAIGLLAIDRALRR
jgi:hypothetical protein